MSKTTKQDPNVVEAIINEARSLGINATEAVMADRVYLNGILFSIPQARDFLYRYEIDTKNGFFNPLAGKHCPICKKIFDCLSSFEDKKRFFKHRMCTWNEEDTK